MKEWLFDQFYHFNVIMFFALIYYHKYAHRKESKELKKNGII